MPNRLPDSLEVQKAVASSLQTLESIDRGSLMSRKGRQCLERFLRVLETVGTFECCICRGGSVADSPCDKAPHAASVPNDMSFDDTTLTGAFDDMLAQFVAEPACDFVLQSSQLGFLDSDMGFPDSGFGGQQPF